jgi:hypothetical protein
MLFHDRDPKFTAAVDADLAEANVEVIKTRPVIVSQPYLNMYRPGSVTRPAFCHVTLLTTDCPSAPSFSKKLYYHDPPA